MAIVTNTWKKHGCLDFIAYKYISLLVAALTIFSCSYAHPLNNWIENDLVLRVAEHTDQSIFRQTYVVAGHSNKTINKKMKPRKVKSYSFNDMRLSDILLKLERWFEVKFRYEDCLENKVYTITRIYNDEPIEKLLTLFEKLDAFSFIRKGDTIHLYKKQEPDNGRPSCRNTPI